MKAQAAKVEGVGVVVVVWEYWSYWLRLFELLRASRGASKSGGLRSNLQGT
jgi:hypothetical protein